MPSEYKLISGLYDITTATVDHDSELKFGGIARLDALSEKKCFNYIGAYTPRSYSCLESGLLNLPPNMRKFCSTIMTAMDVQAKEYIANKK